jgi:hypothetical protein
MPPPELQKSRRQENLKHGPIRGAFTPIQSDTIDLHRVALGIYVGVAGDVKVTGVDGDDYVMVELTAGVWHPCEIVRVWTIGTAATGILCGNG